MLGRPLLPEWRWWPALAFLAYCLLVGYGFASQHPPQTRGIETEQKTKNAPTGENSAKPQTTESDGDIATNAKDGRADEGSEYWPSFLGLRLKITDSFLALFTFLLVVVGGIQGRLIRDQINLARDEFISTHRPKLIVRQFQLESADSDQPIKVAFSIINIGSTEATVRHITAQVVLWNGKHFEKPGINPLINPIANPVTIRNGQRISAKTKSEFNVTAAQIELTKSGELVVCAVGETTYVDALGTERRTGFRRNYDATADMFNASPNEEQEYQD